MRKRAGMKTAITAAGVCLAASQWAAPQCLAGTDNPLSAAAGSASSEALRLLALGAHTALIDVGGGAMTVESGQTVTLDQVAWTVEVGRDQIVLTAAGRRPVRLSVAAAPAAKAPEPAQPIWSVAPGTKLRDQIAQWLAQANAGGCGAPADPCYRLAEPERHDSIELWKITVADAYRGDFLGALTWLRDGFWRSPRPDIEVTQNNVIILRSLGAAQ